MVTSCCAYNCTQRCTSSSNISFHSFPKNPDLLKEWLTAIRRKNFEPSIYSRICSNHFTEESFETSGWSCVPKLKIDAVPSIFDFRKNLPKRKRPTSNIETTDTNGISSGDHENENRQQSVVDISLANENNSNDPTDVNSSPLGKRENGNDEQTTSSISTTSENTRYPNENNLGSTHVRANEKTLCNVKDLEIEEINSLEKDEAINYVKLCKKIIERKNNEIKRLRRKNKRLKIKVSHFKSLFQHPKKKQMPSEQIAV